MSQKQPARDTQQENQEWIDSIAYIIEEKGPVRAKELVDLMLSYAHKQGAHLIDTTTSPYINTIAWDMQQAYPGNEALEHELENIIRWNALAMVVKANVTSDGIGGHIASYASCATLYEVGFNHFFKVSPQKYCSDMVYYQGHTSPGVYARSFAEGRLSTTQLNNFRREKRRGGGIPSYPHPHSMSDYWQFPTVSMGIGALTAIYQARFAKYLINHKLIEDTGQRVWAFCGDGEMDEPESIGGLTLAAREKLDNLTLTVNCNLQRLDGPVRGNGSVVQELESLFKGAGWNVIKVLWGSKWDKLFKQDTSGLLAKRLGELVDGERQKISVSKGSYIREVVFGKYPELLKLVKNYTDEELEQLNLGGHDAVKVYNAYLAATQHKEQPTVILAQTIKGYGLGDAGEARMIAHQQKKLDIDQMLLFKDRFNLPLARKDVKKMTFLKPDEGSELSEYLMLQREKLGGFLPHRCSSSGAIDLPSDGIFEPFYEGSSNKPVATTMVVVKLLTEMLRDPNTKSLIVPIVPDESRTFGMEALFREVGIYASHGQLYTPVDSENFLYYKESIQGSILEEGITEAGAMSSFIAAGGAYSTYGVNMIPFYMFYSMFGFQRVGDFIWAAADSHCKGFMVGATSGKTTLPGEGLQHQDGSSHLHALTVPNLRAYDPAFAYEVAVIVKEALYRMYVKGEELFYYLTVMNEKYPMPPMPQGVEQGIIDGIYPIETNEHAVVKLYGSGALLPEVLLAKDYLARSYNIVAEVWSITSYKQLYDDAIATEKNNVFRCNFDLNTIEKSVGLDPSIHICVTDYSRALPLSISKWFRGEFIALGTDGFGLSDNRSSMRSYFKVDGESIAAAAAYHVRKAESYKL